MRARPMMYLVLGVFCGATSATVLAQTTLPAPRTSATVEAYASALTNERNTTFTSVAGFGVGVSANKSGSTSLPWAENGLPVTRILTASASSSSSATANYGRLQASASGNAQVHGSGAQSDAKSMAMFTDYIQVSGTGPVSMLVGYALEGDITSSPNGESENRWKSTANAAISGRGSLQYAATAQSIWTSGTISVFTGSGTSLQNAISQVVTVNAGAILRLDGDVFASGGSSANSSPTTAEEPRDVSASFAANASSTGEFFLRILTPGASYISASGTQYLTAPSWAAPVPEPEVYALMIAGLALVGVAAMRRRSA